MHYITKQKSANISSVANRRQSDLRRGCRGERGIRFVLLRLLLLFILFMLNVKFISHMTRISFELHSKAQRGIVPRPGYKFVKSGLLKIDLKSCK